MKKTLTSIFAAATLLSAGYAQADVNADLQNICNIVKTDDKSQLRKKLKKVQSDYKLKLRDIYDGISCGGESLIRTALKNDATATGTLMVKKMPKTALAAAEKDGKTLLDWANEQGKTGSPIVTALQDRI